MKNQIREIKIDNFLSYGIIASIVGIWGLRLLWFFLEKEKLDISFYDILGIGYAILAAIDLHRNHLKKREFDEISLQDDRR